jgi:death-on-curing protein
MRLHSVIGFISLADVVRTHEMVINRFGGRSGIRDIGLLESAIHHPWMMLEFGSEEDHEISQLAAAYFFHIIKNHAFVDGNKRTGLLTAVNFIFANGFELDQRIEGLYDDLYRLALDTAMSRVNKDEIASFFKKVMRRIES